MSRIWSDWMTCVAELKAKGLDGLEAIYASFYRDPARRFAPTGPKTRAAGLRRHGFSRQQWRGQSYLWDRNAAAKIGSRSGGALCRPNVCGRRSCDGKTIRQRPGIPQANPPGKPHHFRRRSYVLRIFLPTLIAIALFLAAIWGIILPSFEQTLLERKRELIRELTNSAWSILASYERDEQSGLLTREQAQALAIARMRPCATARKARIISGSRTCSRA